MVVFIALATTAAKAQDTRTPGPLTRSASPSNNAYQLAETNSPPTTQRARIPGTRDYNLSTIAKGIYPQFNVNGTATYQSAVTNISIPPINGYKIAIPAVPKDQYKLYGEISQTITGFGINRQQREISNTDAALQEQNLNTDLYQLKDRINQLYFGALLHRRDQILQNDLAAKDIQTGIAERPGPHQ